jgi:hypothetical protein
LSKRLKYHRKDCKNKNYPIYKFIKENNIDYDIRLIENVDCNNRQELLKKEAEYQILYKDTIKNCYIAGRTKNEWYIDNKNTTLQQQKEYRQSEGAKNKQQGYYKKRRDNRVNCEICEKEVRSDYLKRHKEKLH